MNRQPVEVSVRGKITTRDSYPIEGRSVLISGGWLKMATIHDEEWLDQKLIENPATFVAALKGCRPRPDLFSFAAAEPETEPCFSSHVEWDNVAVIRLESYQRWWSALPQESRRNVRLAEKKGVVTKAVPFDDKLVEGIKGIYDETPIRQGRRFWHYGKSVDAVRHENATYKERSCFIGAYFKDDLIGFIKMVYVGRTARIMQILSKNQHFDKRPANALIAKAVEISCQQNMSYFAYCRYVYGNKRNSSITEFKRRNGFEELKFPRYYFPITALGAVALRLRLHLGARHFIPESMIENLLALRTRILNWTSKWPPVDRQNGSKTNKEPAVAE